METAATMTTNTGEASEATSDPGTAGEDPVTHAVWSSSGLRKRTERLEDVLGIFKLSSSCLVLDVQCCTGEQPTLASIVTYTTGVHPLRRGSLQVPPSHEERRSEIAWYYLGDSTTVYGDIERIPIHSSALELGATNSFELKEHLFASDIVFGSPRPYQNAPRHSFLLRFLSPNPTNHLHWRMKVLNSVSNAFYDVGILTWDVLLTLGNLVRFSRPVGKVTPEGRPGYGGNWPEYRPPQEGDSRCCCPCLNAMANHGIIPRSGRGIKFTEVPEGIHSTFNFSPSFCYYVCHYASRMLNKSYRKDTFDLEEISLHNGIEHDASLTRLDTALQPNQAAPHSAYVEEFLSFASGKDADGNPLFTNKDLSRILGKRRAESKMLNKDYSLRLVHRLFSSANTSTVPTIFGGRADDLRVIFSEERLPQGWESRVRKPYGLTIHTINVTTCAVELGIREADWADDAKRASDAAKQATEEGA